MLKQKENWLRIPDSLILQPQFLTAKHTVTYFFTSIKTYGSNFILFLYLDPNIFTIYIVCVLRSGRTDANAGGAVLERACAWQHLLTNRLTRGPSSRHTLHTVTCLSGMRARVRLTERRNSRTGAHMSVCEGLSLGYLGSHVSAS
jgi:hypothetical protein